ncbi:MAG: DUF4004 family protein [Lachnospiraceae bacterium]|nr:DUF4004 family protein [Lachnospiraceae bacterium]
MLRNNVTINEYLRFIQLRQGGIGLDHQDRLISKKDLLARYRISYGSLYRWKRKGLIPDEWFIKKSTVTGQETFFPESLICERVERILSTKDDILLDELASKLSGEDRNNKVVIIETVYGAHSYRIADIKGVFSSDGKGERKDITKLITEQNQEDQQW